MNSLNIYKLELKEDGIGMNDYILGRFFDILDLRLCINIQDMFSFNQRRVALFLITARGNL